MIKLIVSAFLIVGLVAGCSSNKSDIIPTDGATMEDIYYSGSAGDVAGSNISSNNVSRQYSQPITPANTDGLHGELNKEFPDAPNPTLYMYVNKHLTKHGLPILGYTTKFRMHEKSYYALPGELK